jgi:hypothetical protein
MHWIKETQTKIIKRGGFLLCLCVIKNETDY